ncbi:MAG: beta-N-acetylglucosaminidase domain-containing protein, partial [bacterium]|nr:beta-N-acetylglucosaminidase domain-containing protein [bacterium]
KPGEGGIKVFKNSNEKILAEHVQKNNTSNIRNNELAEAPRLSESPPFFTGKILPTPQKVEYLNKYISLCSREDTNNTSCILISKDGSKEDAGILDLSSRIQNLGGKIDIIKDGENLDKYSTIISVGDNQLSAKYLKQNKLIVPDKEEGYLLYPLVDKNRNIVLCMGHDKLGEYWGIQSLRQLLVGRNREVCLAEARVFDYPAFRQRGYFVSPITRTFFVQHGKFAPEYKFNTVFLNGALFSSFEGGWDSWKKNQHEEGMSDIKDIAVYMKQRGLISIVLIHGNKMRFYSSDYGYNTLKKDAEIRISEDKDIQGVSAWSKSLLSAGVGGICINYDDTCYPMNLKDKEKFGDAAHAHAYLINRICALLKKDNPDFRFFFCPPFYMSKWQAEGLGKYENGDDYLRFLGANIPRNVEVFWTGPDVISRRVTQENVQQWVGLLGRNTAYFDNLFGGPHPGYSYYFDPKDFKTQFPADFQRCLSTYMMAGYSWGHYRVCLATLGDYLWNPENYDPEESLKTAVAQIAGPDMYPLLMNWREKISRFDQFGEGRVTPGNRKLLPELRIWLDELKLAFRQVEQQCRNPLLLPGMKWHTDIWEKFVARVEKEDINGYEEALHEVKVQACKETGAKSDDVFLVPYDFSGGYKGIVGEAAKNVKRHAAWVYGTENVSRMSADFSLAASYDHNCKLAISGLADYGDKGFRMRILMNDNLIFEGEIQDSGFNNEKWTIKEFPLQPSFLNVGKNTLLIENLEKKGTVGAGPWLMINYAVVKS